MRRIVAKQEDTILIDDVDVPKGVITIYGGVVGIVIRDTVNVPTSCYYYISWSNGNTSHKCRSLNGLIESASGVAFYQL